MVGRNQKLYGRIRRCPELERVYAALPLVLNVPGRMVLPLAQGIDAGREGLLESACPYESPELRRMWLDGYWAGKTRTGPISVRATD